MTKHHENRKSAKNKELIINDNKTKVIRINKTTGTK